LQSPTSPSNPHRPAASATNQSGLTPADLWESERTSFSAAWEAPRCREVRSARTNGRT
jgi:hypothetical protein